MPARTEPLAGQSTTPWLTKRESARYLRISIETLDRWHKDGIVTYHKVAGLQSVRCHRDELDAIHVPVPVCICDNYLSADHDCPVHPRPGGYEDLKRQGKLPE